MRKIDIGAAPLAPGYTGERIALETAKCSAARGADVQNTPRVNQQRPINWRFDDILTFISVVEAGSVTSAATRLNLSKTERSCALVLRADHPAGPGIAEATEGVSQREEYLTGWLRVTAPVSFGTNFLGPVLAEFARRYPELEIAVDYEDRCVNLTQGGYDVGIRMGQLKESSLKARKLFDCARIVCCSPGYAANHGMPESMAKLAAIRASTMRTLAPPMFGNSTLKPAAKGRYR
jgi:DNA-binding transcriptional LysR family regulator